MEKPDKSRSIVSMLIRILITILTLAWVLTRIDFNQVWAAVRSAQWHFLFLAWTLSGMLIGIVSLRFMLILKKVDCKVRLSTLVGASAVSTFYSMFMPQTLSSAVKWYILRQDTGKGNRVLSGMLYNQLIIFTVLSSFGLAALIVSNPVVLVAQGKMVTVREMVYIGILAFFIVLVLLALLSSRRMGKIIPRITAIMVKPLPGALRRRAQDLLDQLGIFQSVGLRFHLMMSAITAISSVIGGSVTYVLAARAANIAVSPLVLVWLWMLVYLLGRLPISIANLGVREATLVGILGLYGVEEPVALLMSMILFSAKILLAIAGGVCQFVLFKKNRLRYQRPD